jgi:hypothetical protein
MRSRCSVAVAVFLAGALPAVAAAAPPGAGPTTLVVCAPGYPGSTAEAASVMATFAEAEPPPDIREFLRVPVDEEGREIEAQPT